MWMIGITVVICIAIIQIIAYNMGYKVGYKEGWHDYDKSFRDNRNMNIQIKKDKEQHVNSSHTDN
jgi:hypothetical protein